jgi:hypothetical protein
MRHLKPFKKANKNSLCGSFLVGVGKVLIMPVGEWGTFIINSLNGHCLVPRFADKRRKVTMSRRGENCSGG